MDEVAHKIKGTVSG